jgi:hypothetical protein
LSIEIEREQDIDNRKIFLFFSSISFICKGVADRKSSEKELVGKGVADREKFSFCSSIFSSISYKKLFIGTVGVKWKELSDS